MIAAIAMCGVIAEETSTLEGLQGVCTGLYFKEAIAFKVNRGASLDVAR